jgi:hypothetical protein
MPKRDPSNTPEKILENLISIARLHWSQELTNEMTPQLELTARNINQIMQDVPDPEMEP